MTVSTAALYLYHSFFVTITVCQCYSLLPLLLEIYEHLLEAHLSVLIHQALRDTGH